MADERENKVSKPYSLDPVVIAWVSRKANRLTDESRDKGGPRISESQLVNDILTEAMEDDKYKTSPKIPSPIKREKRNHSATPMAA